MKNKTRKIIKITLAILLVVLIQSIGITYAKYIASENASGHADIAQWAFEIVKDGEETKNVKLISTVNKDSLVNGKIAPGTYGQIKIQLDGTGSEVDLDYRLKFFNEQDKPRNLFFTYNEKIYESIEDIPEIQGNIKYNDERKVKDIVIAWEWRYQTGIMVDEINASDIVDTQDANTIKEYTFDIAVTATQSE